MSDFPAFSNKTVIKPELALKSQILENYFRRSFDCSEITVSIPSPVYPKDFVNEKLTPFTHYSVDISFIPSALMELDDEPLPEWDEHNQIIILPETGIQLRSSTKLVKQYRWTLILTLDEFQDKLPARFFGWVAQAISTYRAGKSEGDI